MTRTLGGLALLLSMTGYGEAHREQDGVAVSVEARAINNRYLKLALKCSEGYATLEGEIEQLVRRHIRRGTVQIALRIHRAVASNYAINVAVLESYRRQLDALHGQWGLHTAVGLDSMLLLPGVVDESSVSPDEVAREWPLISATVEAALSQLDRMRRDEGAAMAVDLRANRQVISAELAGVAARAPQVAEAYRARLSERLRTTLAELDVKLDASDLIKEVSIFAERSDVSEEVVRLGSHLEQFDSIMELGESSGRKLEFLTQELNREANTIGSKANDVQISRHVIEIKASIERIREMIQNIE